MVMDVEEGVVEEVVEELVITKLLAEELVVEVGLEGGDEKQYLWEDGGRVGGDRGGCGLGGG